MAMTFTLVSHLRERLAALIRNREEKHTLQESERQRRQLEVRWTSMKLVIHVYLGRRGAYSGNTGYSRNLYSLEGICLYKFRVPHN